MPEELKALLDKNWPEEGEIQITYQTAEAPLTNER